MRRPMLLLLVLAAALGVSACGRDDRREPASRGLAGAKTRMSAESLGFPGFATKNTTRVSALDGIETAAAVARAVFPDPARKPEAVTLVDSEDWRSAVAAAALMAPPVRAPLLFTEGNDLPDPSKSALSTLDPPGSGKVGGAEVIRVGNVAKPSGRKSTDVAGKTPFARARSIARLLGAARGRTPSRAVIVSADAPEFAAPAAAYAAKSGDPVLFVTAKGVPPETRAALAGLLKPKIYVLGPSKVISPRITRQLRRLGPVKRVGGQDPVTNAIEFARFFDGPFGWGVVDSGHGLVFARSGRPDVAAGAAALSASGTYGPLLHVKDADALPTPVHQYLLDIQPGYRTNPVRGVYNHGWIVGDEDAISVAVQARIDVLLEIVPEDRKSDSSSPR